MRVSWLGHSRHQKKKRKNQEIEKPCLSNSDDDSTVSMSNEEVDHPFLDSVVEEPSSEEQFGEACNALLTK